MLSSLEKATDRQQAAQVAYVNAKILSTKLDGRPHPLGEVLGCLGEERWAGINYQNVDHETGLITDLDPTDRNRAVVRQTIAVGLLLGFFKEVYNLGAKIWFLHPKAIDANQ